MHAPVQDTYPPSTLINTFLVQQQAEGTHRVTLHIFGGEPGSRMQYEMPLNVVPTSNAITRRRAFPLYLDDLESDIVPSERTVSVVKRKLSAIQSAQPECTQPTRRSRSQSAYAIKMIAADHIIAFWTSNVLLQP